MNTKNLLPLLLRLKSSISETKFYLFVLLFLSLSVNAIAQPVNIVVTPATTGLPVGQSFGVLVAADFTGATPPLGVDEIEIHLAFDNTKLIVTSITEGPVVAAFTSKPIPLEAAPYTVTNASGQINYAASTLTGIPTTDFPVLLITFTVIGGAGTTTALDLLTVPPLNETNTLRTGVSNLGSAIDGTVSINAIGCPTPTATISAPAAGVICNGEDFGLTLSSAVGGVAPYDLTIAGPNGIVTYNDIPIGGLITNFTPPVENIWPADPAPIPPTSEDAAVTLGVKFQSSVTGFVNGVRFFSPSEVSLTAGAYTGQLWTTGGTLLASGTFTGVTTDSWQELIFTTPVLLAANTTYIASYHTTFNKYVSTAGGLAAAVTNGSLTALANVASGGNGLYSYGGAPVFPTNSVGANYWVDVIFSPNNYTFNLVNVKDANECGNFGALQTLNVTSTDCANLPVIEINPPTTAVAVGQSFTVSVAVDFPGATPPGVDEIELHLSFDNAKLQVTSITEEPIVAAFPTKTIPLEAAPYTTTNADGQINYAASTTTGIPTADFNVLSITFLVIGGEGTTTPLTLRTEPPLNETNALLGGSSVLSGVLNGIVTINAAGCVTPLVTISAPGAAVTCDGQPFNLILATAPAGVAPFDVTITGPNGTATYDDIAVGGVITNFTPATEKIWPAAPVPTPPSSEDLPLTLGVKFQSSVSGFVTGVRFFSADAVSLAPGAYTGQLWTSGGTLLASGTFTGLSTNTWQELTFATPVLITANTTYVASYHKTHNSYVGTAGGLVLAVTNGSLTALADVASGGNGVYTYGATPAFPTSSAAFNYWVDVIFSANTHTFNLTNVKDANECGNSGALQTLTVTSGDCSTLPVTLSSISASPKENAVLLSWTTSSEFNNLGFEIQRSSTGSSWSVIAFVNGAGNSTSTLHYSYVDGNLVPGRYYYRLKQIDIDRRFAYSAIVSATLDGKETFTLEQNFPNPFSNETMVRFTLARRTKVNLSLFDMNGKLVKVLVSETKESGTHALNVHAGTLTSGLYYYKIQAGEFTAVKKMIIQ